MDHNLIVADHETKTNKQVVDKENVLSDLESKSEPHVCVYLLVGLLKALGRGKQGNQNDLEH